MTPEKILEIARRYGDHDLSDVDWYFYNPDLIAFAQAVIDAERESSDEPVSTLRRAMHDIYEVYAGSEGFIPETCPEAYLQERIKEMAYIAGKHKHRINGEEE